MIKSIDCWKRSLHGPVSESFTKDKKKRNYNTSIKSFCSIEKHSDPSEFLQHRSFSSLVPSLTHFRLLESSFLPSIPLNPPFTLPVQPAYSGQLNQLSDEERFSQFSKWGSNRLSADGFCNVWVLHGTVLCAFLLY